MTGAASWYHCSVKTMSRSAGRSVVAAAAYRLGERLHETEVDQTHDYRRRGGVLEKLTFAPADAPAWAHDPERLWNMANAAETRKNSTLAREVELALPASVAAESRSGIVRAFSQHLVDRYGVAVSVGIHEPSRDGDQRNHHAHILFTTRRMEPDGLGAKTRVLDDRKTGPHEVVHLRALACDLINDALADAGSDERVDHRSFAARGIEQEPTTHLGPGGTALERRDAETERGVVNDDITDHNQKLDELVAELAVIDAAIAKELERELDDRYGDVDRFAWDDVVTETTLLSQLTDAPPELILRRQEGDGFAAVLDETLRQAEPYDPGLAAFLPEPPVTVAASPAFEAVEKETISQANHEVASKQTEAAEQGGGRFARVSAWWGNMREYVAGWREQVQERASHYLSWWEKEDMQERAAEHPPATPSYEAPAAESDLTP